MQDLDQSPKTISDVPNAQNNLRDAIKMHDLGMLRSLEICFPACIYSYDRANHTADVMPLIKEGFFYNGWGYLRRGVFRVSVRNIQCGGFTLDVPLYVGDTGWVFSSDRSTVYIKETGALTNSVLEKDRDVDTVEDDYQKEPCGHSLHILRSGFFIPDNWGPWETNRYKDFPGLSIGDSIYIGSSFDTSDDRSGDKFQKGNGYEKKNSSSVIVQRHGGSHLCSATPFGMHHSNVSSLGEKIVIESRKDIVTGTGDSSIDDNDEESSSSITCHATDGITLRHDDTKNKRNFLMSISGGKFTLRMVEDGKSVSFSFNDGTLNMQTSGDVNIQSLGDLNVQTDGDAYINSANARVVASKTASVASRNAHVSALETANVNAGKTVNIAGGETTNINSGEIVNIGSVETTNINGGEKVNLASGKDINVTAGDNVNIVTGTSTTIMSKKENANIEIATLSKGAKIGIKSKGTNSKMTIDSSGKDSIVDVKAETGSINVSSKETTVTGSGMLNLKGDSVKISGSSVVIDGDVKVNGNSMSPGRIADSPAWQY